MGWVSSKVIKKTWNNLQRGGNFGRYLNMKHATRWVRNEVKINQKMIIALKTTL